MERKYLKVNGKVYKVDEYLWYECVRMTNGETFHLSECKPATKKEYLTTNKTETHGN